MVVPPVKYWTAVPVIQVRVATMVPEETVHVAKRLGLVKATGPVLVKPAPQEVQVVNPALM